MQELAGTDRMTISNSAILDSAVGADGNHLSVERTLPNCVMPFTSPMPRFFHRVHGLGEAYLQASSRLCNEFIHGVNGLVFFGAGARPENGGGSVGKLGGSLGHNRTTETRHFSNSKFA